MAEELQKVHLFYDDINKIKVLEENVLKDTEDLRDTCKEYENSRYLSSTVNIGYVLCIHKFLLNLVIVVVIN